MGTLTVTQDYLPILPLLPPVVNDDVDNDTVFISKPPLIYVDNDALFHSDHTDNENYNQVLRANEDRDEGGDRDGRKLDNKDDDASGDDIGDGDDVDTGNGIGFKDTGDGVSVSNTRDLGANYAITEMANTSFWHAQGAANAYSGGEPDIEVMGAEYAQLTNQRVHIQTDLDALTQEQKNIVFNPINLVKVK